MSKDSEQMKDMERKRNGTMTENNAWSSLLLYKTTLRRKKLKTKCSWSGKKSLSLNRQRNSLVRVKQIAVDTLKWDFSTVVIFIAYFFLVVVDRTVQMLCNSSWNESEPIKSTPFAVAHFSAISFIKSIFLFQPQRRQITNSFA